jgi:hypothetical protein
MTVYVPHLLRQVLVCPLEVGSSLSCPLVTITRAGDCAVAPVEPLTQYDACPQTRTCRST